MPVSGSPVRIVSANIPSPDDLKVSGNFFSSITQYNTIFNTKISVFDAIQLPDSIHRDHNLNVSIVTSTIGLLCKDGFKQNTSNTERTKDKTKKVNIFNTLGNTYLLEHSITSTLAGGQPAGNKSNTSSLHLRQGESMNMFLPNISSPAPMTLYEPPPADQLPAFLLWASFNAKTDPVVMHAQNNGNSYGSVINPTGIRETPMP